MMYPKIIHKINNISFVRGRTRRAKEGKEANVKETRNTYETAEIEIILFRSEDVIATSSTDNVDENGWTDSWN